MSKIHNFSAGPCILPQEVLKQASEAVINFNNLNLSLIEISHRSKDFVEVMEKAQALVKELLDWNSISLSICGWVNNCLCLIPYLICPLISSILLFTIYD